MATERVTIAHIADAAGVSVPTVSKVVNGRADVAPGATPGTVAGLRGICQEVDPFPRSNEEAAG